ncbi:MAG: apolipoprotein N-acyltransferase, partial [Planctomycetia bacterium]
CTPGVFPWKLGYSQIAWPMLVQSVDLFGPEFATFVLFAHAGVLVAAALAIGQWFGRGATRGSATNGGQGFTAAALAICVANLAYGLGSMAWWDRQAEAAPSLRVLLVQANPEEHDGVDALRRLTREATSTGAAYDLICWPECSGGSYETSLKSFTDAEKVMALSRDPRRGLRPLENPGCHLLFGGKIYEGHPQKPRSLYQSAILVDSAETILGCYHKRHLMPFGEYVPGEEWYPEIKHYFPMQDVLTEGQEACVLPAPSGARIGAMLCYEDMIPSAARSLVNASANLLVSLINGSAFTEPLTLAQHRLLAQMRAVECRRTLIRTAATGETCVISPVGRVTARLPLHAEDTLAISVPLLESRTLYGVTGNLFPFCCAAGLAAVAWRARSRTG